MKLKIKLIGAAALLGAAMLVNANMGTNEKSRDVLLTDLVNATEANAECLPGNVKNGRCNAMGTWCYLTPFEEDQDCDFYYNNRQF